MTTAKTNLDDLNTLHEQREQLQAQMFKTAEQIRNIVIRDLPRYLERETRWRWVRHIEFATNMSDAQIQNIKSGLHALTQELSPVITEQLSDNALWLSPDTPKIDNDKSLELNAKLWAVLQGIAARLGEFLGEFKFPNDPEASEAQPYHLQYRTPTYFLDGHYCPRLIETYWGHIAHLNHINTEIQAIHDDAARLKLEARWNTIQAT